MRIPGYSYAFISYQTSDKQAAKLLKTSLERAGIRAFMAHEDIEVSDEWRLRILAELKATDIFITLLSEEYLKSYWCVQESGIAAMRDDMLVVPLSIDGTKPPGFLSSYQSVKVDASSLDVMNIAPAFTKRDLQKGISTLVTLIGSSFNYRGAEANFALLMPHLTSMENDLVTDLIESAAKNAQVSEAALCAKEYIPAVLRSFKTAGSPEAREALVSTCKRYGVDV